MDIKPISVCDRLPRENEKCLFAFKDIDGKGHLEGSLAFFNSQDKSWIGFGENSEAGYKFNDITKEVDYWAVVPDEFWGDEE